jgi:hypothetical protein
LKRHFKAALGIAETGGKVCLGRKPAFEGDLGDGRVGVN